MANKLEGTNDSAPQTNLATLSRHNHLFPLDLGKMTQNLVQKLRN